MDTLPADGGLNGFYIAILVALALIAGAHPARRPLWMAALGVCEVTAP